MLQGQGRRLSNCSVPHGKDLARKSYICINEIHPSITQLDRRGNAGNNMEPDVIYSQAQSYHYFSLM
jgi:hypothetical protein